jgi:hypothetical protein
MITGISSSLKLIFEIDKWLFEIDKWLEFVWLVIGG